MKKLLIALCVVLWTTVVLYAAGITRISFGTTIPTNCVDGNIFIKTTATAGLYWCSAPGSPGTFSLVSGGSGTVTHTGTLTAKNLITGNGGSDITAVAATDGQVPIGKTSDGSVNLSTLTAGTNISITNGAGSVTISATGSAASVGLVGPLETHAASASTTLDFTTCFSGSYVGYLFRFNRIVPATNAAVFGLEFGTGGGPTWDTSADYRWASWATDNASATGASGSSSTGPATRITIHTTVNSTASNGGVGGWLFLDDPQNSAASNTTTFQVAGFSGASTWGQFTGGGQFIPTTTLTGVRFLFSTGNITSGSISCYGFS